MQFFFSGLKYIKKFEGIRVLCLLPQFQNYNHEYDFCERGIKHGFKQTLS